MHHSTSYILHSTLRCPFYILHFTFYILLAFAMMSCTSSTSPNTGSLSGRVILVNDTGDPSLDPVDFSGVTVALYELAVLDTTIVRINQEYPHIGVQISQETEFDYYRQSPLNSVLTGPDGNFNVSGLKNGIYNIVVRSELWGIKVLYNVAIDINKNTLEDIHLYPVVLLENTELNRVIFMNDHLYMVTTDTQLLNGADVTGACHIEIGDGKQLRIIGDLSNIDNSYVYINSADTTIDSRFHCIELLNQNSDIERVILRNSSNGLKMMSTEGSVVVRDCVFSSSDVGLYIAAAASSDVQNCLFNHCVSNNTNYGALLLSAFGSLVTKNIFVDNQQAVKSYQNSSNCITDNYFQSNNIGVDSSYDTGDSIKYNTFLFQGSYAIQMTAIDSCFVEYNQIVGSIGIHHYYEGTGGYAPTIRNNNLNCTIRAIRTDPTHTPYDLIADSNHYYTADPSRIDELIWDENDRLIEYPQGPKRAGYVLHTPYRVSRVITAGIRG